jgi:hypothetical protein
MSNSAPNRSSSVRRGSQAQAAKLSDAAVMRGSLRRNGKFVNGMSAREIAIEDSEVAVVTKCKGLGYKIFSSLRGRASHQFPPSAFRFLLSEFQLFS